MSKLSINPYSVTHDELTGLPNSFLFYDRLNTNIAIAERSTTRFSILHIEFKNIELMAKKYGKGISDALLIRITERLNDSLREADTVARLDEYAFGIIITHLVNKNAIDSLVYRIYKILSLPYQVNGDSLSVKVSIGMSVYPDNGMNATLLTNYATTHALNYD